MASRTAADEFPIAFEAFSIEVKEMLEQFRSDILSALGQVPQQPTSQTALTENSLITALEAFREILVEKIEQMIQGKQEQSIVSASPQPISLRNAFEAEDYLCRL